MGPKTKQGDCIWLSWCVWVCAEGSPTLQEKLVGKEHLLTRMTSSIISCVMFHDWGGNTEVPMNFGLSCPTPPPSLRYIYTLNWENLKCFCHDRAGTRKNQLWPYQYGERVSPPARIKKLIYHNTNLGKSQNTTRRISRHMPTLWLHLWLLRAERNILSPLPFSSNTGKRNHLASGKKKNQLTVHYLMWQFGEKNRLTSYYFRSNKCWFMYKACTRFFFLDLSHERNYMWQK